MSPEYEKEYVLTDDDAREAVSKSFVDEDALRAVLTATASDALANPSSGELAYMSIPQKWLANGCDLEADILPAVRAVAERCRKGNVRVRSWSYFDQEVSNAKARREGTLPDPQPQAPRSEAFQADLAKRREAQEAALKQLFEEYFPAQAVGA